MGFFDRLFGQSQTKKQVTSPATNNGNNSDWEFYFSNIDNKLGSLFVDLGLRSIAPVKDKPNAIWISVKMNNPLENGLSSSEESNILSQIEDTLVNKMHSEFEAIYAGRATSNGYRDLYFYSGETALHDKAFSAVMVAFPNYDSDYGSKEDKDWQIYFNFLYPSPEQLQNIQNRRVVDKLRNEGDKLIKLREVDHWVYFKTQDDQETFLSKIKTDGFTTVDKGYNKKLGDHPFRLNLRRVDKVDLDSVNEYTIHLWKLATECHGEYDGWETSIEKD